MGGVTKMDCNTTEWGEDEGMYHYFTCFSGNSVLSLVHDSKWAKRGPDHKTDLIIHPQMAIKHNSKISYLQRIWSWDEFTSNFEGMKDRWGSMDRIVNWHLCLVISLTYVSNKPDLSHIVISNVSFWGFKDKIFLIINSTEMVFYSTMVSSNDLPRDSE